MAKHTVNGALYLYVSKYSMPDRPVYHFHAGQDLDGDSFVKIVDHSFVIEIPEDFDPVPGQIAALNEKKRLLRVKLADELREIDDRLSKLQAITFEPEAA